MVDEKYLEAKECQCNKIRRASRTVTHLYDKFLEPSGLKATQYALLANIKRAGSITMVELSKVCRLERTTLIRNIKLLEDREFVNSINEQHSKAYTITLTTKGLKFLEDAYPYWKEAQIAISKLLSDEEINMLDSILQKLESLDS